MSLLVSTGQITIVDNNDAKPITAFITTTGISHQIYTKDESTTSYIPDWTSTPLVLTAKVYVGGTTSATDITANLTNKIWSTDLTTSLGAGTTFTISTNLTTATPAKNYYFAGDYTDPVTGLVSHVIAQFLVSLVQTGTNAVYIQTSGQQVIEQATGTTKNNAIMKADLIRAAGIDDTGTTYQWYQYPFTTADRIDASLANVTTKYGFRTTAQANAGSGSAIGTGIPAAGGAFTDTKAIIIDESAVNNIGLYKVIIQDADSKQWIGFFSIYDVTDKYQTTLISTSGDKLQNGVGSTDIYPIIYYGATKVTNLSSWSFKFYYNDASGARAGFIDTTRTAQAGGRSITANTSGAAAVVTYSGAPITFASNDIVKLVTSTGTAQYYEVASGTGNTVTLRVPATTQTFLTWTAPTASQFVSGVMYVCTAGGTRTTSGANANDTAPKITVTGDEIDVKGNIICESTRP